MKLATIIVLASLVSRLDAQQLQDSTVGISGRRYWPVSVDSLASGLVKHTHVRVTGRIRLKRWELDTDLHLKLSGVNKYIIAECIPTSCDNCRNLESTGVFDVGKRITIFGIARYDAEHGWWEVHPIEGVIVAKVAQ